MEPIWLKLPDSCGLLTTLWSSEAAEANGLVAASEGAPSREVLPSSASGRLRTSNTQPAFQA